MAASKVEVLEQMAYGMAKDLLDAISEIETVDGVSIDACDARGIQSVHCSAWSGARCVFDRHLVGDELPGGDGCES